MKRLVLILAAALAGAAMAASCGPSAGDRAAAPRQWADRVLDNGYVVAGASSKMGGRLTHLALEGDPFNHVRLESDAYLATPPAAVYPYFYGLNAGGIRGVHHPNWPGLSTNAKDYAYEPAVDDRGPAIIGSAVADGVLDERRVVLLSDSTVCRIETRLTNQRTQAVDLMVRLNGEYDVGPGGAVTCLPDGAGGVVKIGYVLGREEGRGMHPSRGDWVAKVDPASAQVMLIRYPPKDVAGVLVWTGAGGAENAPQFAEMPRDYHGFVGYNLFTRPAETPPGGSVASWQEHVLLAGLTDVDLVAGDRVFQLDVPETVRRGDPLMCRVRAAAPRRGRIEGATVRVIGPDGRVLGERAVAFDVSMPGRARVQEVNFLPPWPQGRVTVRLEAAGQRAERVVDVVSPP